MQHATAIAAVEATAGEYSKANKMSWVFRHELYKRETILSYRELICHILSD